MIICILNQNMLALQFFKIIIPGDEYKRVNSPHSTFDGKHALGQAGTTVRGAYDVLVSMGILSYFLPYVFLFAAMIRLQGQTAGPEVRRVPGGKPVAILLASVGLASTALTIVLSAFPAHDDPNKPLAVAKVLGGTIVLVGAGVLVFVVERRRARKRARLV
jgi:amino acid transporter